MLNLLSIAILLLSVNMLVLLFLYARVSKELSDRKKREEALRSKAREQAMEHVLPMLRKAFEEELSKVAKAQIKALEAISHQFTLGYKKTLTSVEGGHRERLEAVIQDIEGEALSEMKNFKDILEKETLVSQKIVEEKIEQEYATVQKELSVYKSEKLKEIDESIYKFLANVSKLVFGKVLSLEEHQELVMKALEEAKKEGIFDVQKYG